MEFSYYFDPLSAVVADFEKDFHPSELGASIACHNSIKGFPALEGAKIALIGVPEDRRSNNEGCSLAPDQIRRFLYHLSNGGFQSPMIDLGNLKIGASVTDTYVALSSIVSDLIRENIVPIILGGSHDLTYAQYRAYESLEQIINIVTIDARFDMGAVEDTLNPNSYLGKIILHQPNFLFNFSNIGYQSYFIDPAALQLMNKLFFDVYRVGQVRENMEEVEPIVRNADMLSFDVSAIRQSDAPGNKNASPNGFYGEEACRMMRYAGLSEKITSVGFYEMNPKVDRECQTAHLVAQMIWYFIEGFHNRKIDNPLVNKNDFVKYRVALKADEHEIVFHKSNKSGRWWMEVPVQIKKGTKYERHHLVPCSYADYQIACNAEMPDRWWRAFQKLS